MGTFHVCKRCSWVSHFFAFRYSKNTHLDFKDSFHGSHYVGGIRWAWANPTHMPFAPRRDLLVGHRCCLIIPSSCSSSSETFDMKCKVDQSASLRRYPPLRHCLCHMMYLYHPVSIYSCNVMQSSMNSVYGNECHNDLRIHHISSSYLNLWIPSVDQGQ